MRLKAYIFVYVRMTDLAIIVYFGSKKSMETKFYVHIYLHKMWNSTSMSQKCYGQLKLNALYCPLFNTTNKQN